MPERLAALDRADAAGEGIILKDELMRRVEGDAGILAIGGGHDDLAAGLGFRPEEMRQAEPGRKRRLRVATWNPDTGDAHQAGAVVCARAVDAPDNGFLKSVKVEGLAGEVALGDFPAAYSLKI